jgi:hypothetical protein
MASLPVIYEAGSVRLQPRSRRLAPAHLIDGISSVFRNGEIKTERQRVSRDLAVRRVVLSGWVG